MKLLLFTKRFILSSIPIYIIFISISFIVSFNVYKQDNSAFYLKLFPPYLGLTLLIEIVGNYLVNRNIETYILYNIFGVVEFAFFLFILSKIIQNKVMRRIISITLILNALISLGNLLLFQTDSYASISYSVGSLLVVIFCIYYFFELFRYPKFVNLVKEPSFWICSGLLFYFCCSFPLLGLTTFLESIPEVLLNHFFILLNVLNISLYSLFIIAFLCRIKTRNYILR